MDWPSSASSASMSASTCCASAFLSSMRSAWAVGPRRTAQRRWRLREGHRGSHDDPWSGLALRATEGAPGGAGTSLARDPTSLPGHVQREASRNCATKWLQNGNFLRVPEAESSPLRAVNASDTVTRRCGGNDQPRGLRSRSSPARSSGCPRRPRRRPRRRFAPAAPSSTPEQQARVDSSRSSRSCGGPRARSPMSSPASRRSSASAPRRVDSWPLHAEPSRSRSGGSPIRCVRSTRRISPT